jgi:hypothetical protein
MSIFIQKVKCIFGYHRYTKVRVVEYNTHKLVRLCVYCLKRA